MREKESDSGAFAVRAKYLAWIVIWLTAPIFNESISASEKSNAGQDELLLEVQVTAFRSRDDEYRVKLFKSGMAEYYGVQDVRTRTTVRYRVPSKEFQEISKRIRQTPVYNENIKWGCLNGNSLGLIDIYRDGAKQRVPLCPTSVSDDLLPALELFRDLQRLLNTERLRCPHIVKDFGVNGRMDSCKYSEKLLVDEINGLKVKLREREGK